MGKRIKVTFVGYYDPDLEGQGYKGVRLEGRMMDCTTVEEAMVYDQSLYEEGDVMDTELLEWLDNVEVAFEVVEEDVSEPDKDALDYAHLEQ